MPREYNVDLKGNKFSEDIISKVWEKGIKTSQLDPDKTRWDDCRKLIDRVEYGNVSSKYGWEIDHIKPVAKEGTDDLSNLRPLQWETNREKGDTYPWKC